MLRIILFIAVSALVASWLQPLTSPILNMKGDFIVFMTQSLPIGWLGFTAMFSFLGLSILFGILQFFK